MSSWVAIITAFQPNISRCQSHKITLFQKAWLLLVMKAWRAVWLLPLSRHLSKKSKKRLSILEFKLHLEEDPGTFPSNTKYVGGWQFILFLHEWMSVYFLDLLQAHVLNKETEMRSDMDTPKSHGFLVAPLGPAPRYSGPQFNCNLKQEFHVPLTFLTCFWILNNSRTQWGTLSMKQSEEKQTFTVFTSADLI